MEKKKFKYTVSFLLSYNDKKPVYESQEFTSESLLEAIHVFMEARKAAQRTIRRLDETREAREGKHRTGANGVREEQYGQDSSVSEPSTGQDSVD